MERDAVLLENALCWIFEHCEDTEYEHILSDYIGMTDEEINEYGEFDDELIEIILSLLLNPAS